MIVNIDNPTPKKPVMEFPILAKSTVDDGAIVLFWDEDSGVVLGEGNISNVDNVGVSYYTKGEYSNGGWENIESDHWEILSEKASVTLRNEWK